MAQEKNAAGLSMRESAHVKVLEARTMLRLKGGRG